MINTFTYNIIGLIRINYVRILIKNNDLWIIDVIINIQDHN